MPTNPTTLDEARGLVALAEKAREFYAVAGNRISFIDGSPADTVQTLALTALPRLAADYIAAVEDRDAMRARLPTAADEQVSFYYDVRVFWPREGGYGGGTRCDTMEEVEKSVAWHRRNGYGRKSNPVHVRKVYASKVVQVVDDMPEPIAETPTPRKNARKSND